MDFHIWKLSKDHPYQQLAFLFHCEPYAPSFQASLQFLTEAATKPSLPWGKAVFWSSDPCFPVGGLWATILENHCEVDYLCVLKSYQGLGIAKKLMEVFFAWAQKHNLKSVLLEVAKSNCTAYKLYKALGFKIIACRPSYYSTGEDALVMEKAFVLPLNGSM